MLRITFCQGSTPPSAYGLAPGECSVTRKSVTIIIIITVHNEPYCPFQLRTRQ